MPATDNGERLAQELADLQRPEPFDKVVAVTACSIVALWLGWGLGLGTWVATTFGAKAETASASAGQFGDMFGSVNALFTALAFVAVWWTGRKQSRELELQRRTLAVQIQELAETRSQVARTAQAQEDQLAQAKSEAERRLRAYLNLQRLECQLHEGLLVVRFYLQNYGQTPAYRLKPHIGTQVSIVAKGQGPRQLAVIQSPDSAGVVAPSASFHVNFRIELGHEHMIELARGESDVLILGEVHYADAFGEERWIKFDFISEGGLRVNDTRTLSSRGEGNDAN